jgi:hypothetical protein
MRVVRGINTAMVDRVLGQLGNTKLEAFANSKHTHALSPHPYPHCLAPADARPFLASTDNAFHEERSLRAPVPHAQPQHVGLNDLESNAPQLPRLVQHCTGCRVSKGRAQTTVHATAHRGNGGVENGVTWVGWGGSGRGGYHKERQGTLACNNTQRYPGEHQAHPTRKLGHDN